ncbi:MAG: UbiD family decarboxylase [Alphaproteobacteria bacterium]|jgi:2,5-furandicarboxylate decarboxylase 1|nr:UbiD family decarboxylase [Alphaproteobacteria bacterium]
MPDQSYRTFLQNLEQQGELVRFNKEVDPAQNMAAIEWKTYNELGKASLFTNLKGHDGWQAASEILADRKKWAIGLGVEEDDILDEISNRLKNTIKTVEVDSSAAPVQEVVFEGDDVNILDVPSMMTSEEDGGRYFASGMAIVKDPKTGIRNMSIHRQMILNERETGFIMVPRQAKRIYDMYAAEGRGMPVAMVYGAHPAIFYGSGFTTTYGKDELEIAGSLLGEGVRMVKCKTVDIEVPAEAEMVLEGEILFDRMVPEGPFGEIPGTYAEATHANVFRINCMTRRKDPIFYAVHCGYPTTDTQGTMALGIEIATKEQLKNVEGGLDLLDVRCHPSAGMMMVVLKIRPRVEGQAKTALMAALSGAYLHPKLAVAVDDDIDANDLRQVMWSMTTRVHAERDIVMIPNTRVFALDNISPVVPGQNSFHRIGTKWMIDATKPAVTQGDARDQFERAMPRNFDHVDLDDFLP